ncbi:MAG: hypothetical protein WDM85_04130 [Caulobacteraceae bacterium]
MNPTGLVIEQLHAEPALEEGHAALEVTGVIRNVVGRSVIAPPLRITLLNAQGKRVRDRSPASPIHAFRRARRAASAPRSPTPPYSAANLAADFAIGASSASGNMQSAPAVTPQASSVALRGPASDTPAVNAPPLPPSFATPATPVPAPAPAAATNTPAPAAPAATNTAR